MRVLLFVLFIAIGFNCFGQNPPSFDKVIFNYSTGNSNWGDKGVYSRAELFELSPSKSGSYKIKKYLKITNTIRTDSGGYLRDTVIVKRIKQPAMSAHEMDSLYVQLTTTKANFTPEFIRPRLGVPSEKQILRIATDDSLINKFADTITVAPDRKKRIEVIKNFDKLDSFINKNKPDPTVPRVTGDAWDIVKISFIKNSDTTVFNQDYIQLLGQPLEKMKANKRKVDQQFVNLEVNIILEEILPESSILRKRASISSLTEAYIKWYIEEKL